MDHFEAGNLSGGLIVQHTSRAGVQDIAIAGRQEEALACRIALWIVGQPTDMYGPASRSDGRPFNIDIRQVDLLVA
jgi:hypothetical protein